jgi:hypothetical protein
MTDAITTRTDARLWAELEGEERTFEGTTANLEVERNDPNSISVHTFINGRGSLITYELTREGAIELATKLLLEAQLR